MILILHANCIIYIWRICDLPLCRHIQTKHTHTQQQAYTRIYNTSYSSYVRTDTEYTLHTYTREYAYDTTHAHTCEKRLCNLKTDWETDMLTYCDCPCSSHTHRIQLPRRWYMNSCLLERRASGSFSNIVGLEGRKKNCWHLKNSMANKISIFLPDDYLPILRDDVTILCL